MSTRTSESHRGAGSMPVPITPLSTQTQDIELVLHDGPVAQNDMSVVSNAEFGEEQNLIGPIESPFIRGRASNTSVNVQSIGLVLTEVAPPWPNASASADLPARHVQHMI